MLAKAFGARVIATVGVDEKAKACVRLGADRRRSTIADEDFVAATLAATGGKGADVILDMVGGDYVARNYAAAAVDGRIVQIAFLHGRKVELDLHAADDEAARPHRLDAAAALGRREGGDRRRAARKGLAAARRRAAASRSSIRPFRSPRPPKAHARMESSAHVGKIVLTI